MAAAPICTSCNLERKLVTIKPGRNRHDVRSYECPTCRDVFRLVVQREPLQSDELVFDFPVLQAAAR
jgi:transposase-like protein